MFQAATSGIYPTVKEESVKIDVNDDTKPSSNKSKLLTKTAWRCRSNQGRHISNRSPRLKKIYFNSHCQSSRGHLNSPAYIPTKLQHRLHERDNYFFPLISVHFENAYSITHTAL